ncbi:MAG: hypothetical protein LBH29_01370 [Elusimicrobiota bacterium]|jgi:GNAT superfamily N-acetyltransferase|nr:hypothetical protein [Elusimicrobiota bacterium]
MKIIPVRTDRQFEDFVMFPYSLYPKTSAWVPPLISDAKALLTAGKNPFWEHAKKEMFLAYSDSGKIIGRIAGIIDFNYIKFQKDNSGFFGFFECIDDTAVAKELFNAAETWLKSENMPKMIGPMNPSTNDECGFVSEGFDIPPSIMMAYTPEYYLNLARSYGLKKIKELFAYDMEVCPDSRVPRLQRVVDMAQRKMPNIKIRTLDVKNFDSELRKVMKVYNQAWENNWGFVPWTDAEFEYIAVQLKPILDSNLAILAEDNGEPAAFLVSCADYNQVLKRLDGKLYPFGFLKYLYYKNKIDALRLIIMGVIEKYRNKGIEALMYSKGLNYAIKKGYKRCELSWILEDNVMTNRTAEMMNGKIYKRYLIFGKDFK